MKKQITFIIGALLIFTSQLFSQIDVKTIDMAKVNQAKVDGKLNGSEKYVNFDALGKSQARISPNLTIPNSVNTASGCACWIPRDSSWQVDQVVVVVPAYLPIIEMMTGQQHRSLFHFHFAFTDSR